MRFRLGGISDIPEIKEAESSVISFRSGLPGRVETAVTADVETTGEPKTCVTLERGFTRDLERKDEGLEWDEYLPSLNDKLLMQSGRDEASATNAGEVEPEVHDVASHDQTNTLGQVSFQK